MQPVSRLSVHHFPHPVDRLWEIVADTPRWGEALGTPRYQAFEETDSDGRVQVFGQTKIAGMNLRWEEPPSRWVSEQWYEQGRQFQNGPLVSMTSRVRTKALGDESSLEVELIVEPRNLAGYLLALCMTRIFPKNVQRLLDISDRLIRQEKPDLFVSEFQFTESALKRAEAMAAEIESSPYGHGLTHRLVEYIGERQEVDLWTMRPLAIAERWQAASRHVVELFLQSVRTGLLESRWDILCPRCRVSKAQITNMCDLPEGVHCESCNIDYQADFASNVELSFSPGPAIREVVPGFYCRSGPGVTPHIKGQCALDADESIALPAQLPEGIYRIRCLETGDELEFEHDGSQLPVFTIDHSGLHCEKGSTHRRIILNNRCQAGRTLLIEDRVWLKDVLTADQVTTLHAFRDLFSDQVLRPGDEVSIRNITFVFTDLVDSTQLFGNIGDAAAYRIVREHFALLGEIVREFEGSIVKTVGDGIHAAFLDPGKALQACIAMQNKMSAYHRSSQGRAINIRIGINAGSCISVNLNGRLDYYGHTVNQASRLEAAGEAGDISMTRQFAADPAVSELISAYPLRESKVILKGVDSPLIIYQITP